MQEPRRYFVPTSAGNLSLIFAQKHRSRVDLIIHGAGRHPIQLKHWLKFDAVLWELPGHGQAPLLSGDVHSWSSAIFEAITRVFGDLPILAAGESFGGLLALMMKAERHIAFDPFIEPHEAVRKEISEGHLSPWMGEFLSRSYLREICDLEYEFDVVLASLSVDPNSSTPSIVCPGVRATLRSLEHARIFEMDAGHLLFDEDPAGCEAIIFGQSA